MKLWRGREAHPCSWKSRIWGTRIEVQGHQGEGSLKTCPGINLGHLKDCILGIRVNMKYHNLHKDNSIIGGSLVAQWLGFQAFTAMARVQSLVGGPAILQATCHGQIKLKIKLLT